jgi:hypothetical protein
MSPTHTIPAPQGPPSKKPKTQPNLASSYCFTWNNYTQASIDLIAQLYKDGLFTYIIYGKEVAQTGTPHLQGYFRLVSRKRRTQLNNKKLFGKDVQFQITTKNEDCNIKYCSKGEQSHEEWSTDYTAGPNYGLNADVTIFGTFTPKQPGKRNDILGCTDLIDAGKPMSYVAASNPTCYVNSHHGLHAYALATVDAIETTNVRGIWLYGAPGTGKSHEVRAICGDNLFLKAQSKWFDGYALQTNILIDDFDMGGEGLAHHLKLWADRYKAYGEIKGGTVALQHENLFITSNYHPSILFADCKGGAVMLEAILRRFIVVEKTSRSFILCKNITNRAAGRDQFDNGDGTYLPELTKPQSHSTQVTKEPDSTSDQEVAPGSSTRFGPVFTYPPDMGDY